MVMPLMAIGISGVALVVTLVPTLIKSSETRVLEGAFNLREVELLVHNSGNAPAYLASGSRFHLFTGEHA